MNLILRFKFPIIFLIAILTRIFALYFYRDVEVANEWGIILSNLEQYNILSVHSVQGVPVPNIFMPPLYPLFCMLLRFFLQILKFFYGLSNLFKYYLRSFLFILLIKFY